MKTSILLAVLLFAVWVQAQSVVDIKKANFSWNYVGPPVDGFTIKCGRQSGKYTMMRTVANGAARNDPASYIVKTSGQYYCVLTSYNKDGESKPTDEINFAYGVVIPPSAQARKAPTVKPPQKKVK